MRLAEVEEMHKKSVAGIAFKAVSFMQQTKKPVNIYYNALSSVLFFDVYEFEGSANTVFATKVYIDYLDENDLVNSFIDRVYKESLSLVWAYTN